MGPAEADQMPDGEQQDEAKPQHRKLAKASKLIPSKSVEPRKRKSPVGSRPNYDEKPIFTI